MSRSEIRLGLTSSLRANGPARNGRPDGELREAIQTQSQGAEFLFVASLLAMTKFVGSTK
jgi:hypothetical protein